MEIERKFLCNMLPDNLDSFKCSSIEQGYISINPVIRIRRIDDFYKLTIKSKGHIVRKEYELDLDKEQYNNLLSKVENNMIKKTRYYIPLNKLLTAELDIYYGFLNGLITIEVEFDTETDSKNFIPPEWFDKEISFDAKYKNAYLSKHGKPT